MYRGGLGKLGHISGAVAGYAHVLGFVLTRKTWEHPDFLPSVDLEALSKQEVKVESDFQSEH